LKYQDHMKQILQNKNQFIGLLKETKRENIEKLITFVEKRGFFVSPASAKYHNAFDGGLCDHSLKVYHLLLAKVEQHKLKEKYPLETIIIAALCHDLCKLGLYENKVAWRKDSQDKWENYPGYGYLEQQMPTGHGSQSVIMLQNFIKLTQSEILAIYWHMGLTTNPNDMIGYSTAANKCELVTLLHTADLESSYILEPQGVQEQLIALPAGVKKK